jgi:Mlc titration factor MtfA (ptsG expression regulator)
MVFSWLAKQRRTKLLAEPMPAVWLEYLAKNVRHYPYLSPRRQGRVRRVAQVVVAEKNWEGGAGFEVTEEMKVTVAAQTAILAIGQPGPYYFDAVQSIIIYPGPYEQLARFGGPRSVLGEAWYHGPIVLSWRDVLAGGRNESSGRNVVFHEFAHYLDALDGEVDGTPPLVGRQRQRTWFRVTEAEYLRLVGKARRNEVSLLDHYGATNRAEFFAVATECFFEQPHAMQREHRQLYNVLRDFYGQHPARWLPDATVGERRRFVPLEREKSRRQRQRRLAALRSRRPGALFSLAVEYFNERRYLLAAAAATRVIALSPDDGEALVHRALARVRCGRYAAARDDADEASRREPQDSDALVAAAAALVELGEYGEAKENLDKALRLGEDDAEFYYYRGRAWMGLGNPARAVADYERSLAVVPFAAEVFYHCGLAYQALGNEAEAKSALAKALQLDPGIHASKSSSLGRQ